MNDPVPGLLFNGVRYVQEDSRADWQRANRAEAERDELAEQLAQLKRQLGPDYHVFESKEDCWSLQHPLACRPDLLACPLQQAATDLRAPPVEPGRWRVDLVDGELAFSPLPE